MASALIIIHLEKRSRKTNEKKTQLFASLQNDALRIRHLEYKND